jgi:hypothetical protein
MKEITIKRFPVLAVMATAATALAQTAPSTPTPPPAYTPLRYNEDYSYLKDPSRRTDLFDPIKYIPLNESGDWYLSLGAQERYRYEFFNHANFGAGPQDGNGFNLWRTMAHADLHMGNVRIFAQGISALEAGRDGGPRPPDEDQLDLHQLFIDYLIPLDSAGGGASLTLRGGRQNLLYGAQRLISPLDWTNARRTFDGGKASLVLPKNNTLDFFCVQAVSINPDQFDDTNDNVTFTGLYDTLMLPDLIKNAGSRVEAYALYLDNFRAPFAQGTQSENCYTLGGRFYTNPKPWDLDLEAAYQFGDFGSGDVSAWMLASESGYTFISQRLTPRVYLGFDIASGDSNPNNSDLGTFNQLFPLGHAYFGYIDVVGRQNVIDLHPGVELTLMKEARYFKKVTLRGDYHVFWRYSNDDALYNAAGGIQRADNGSDESFVGSEVDLLLNWQIDRHMATYFGYSHFFAGDFLQQTGPSDDIDFFYAAFTYTF